MPQTAGIGLPIHSRVCMLVLCTKQTESQGLVNRTRAPNLISARVGLPSSLFAATNGIFRNDSQGGVTSRIAQVDIGGLQQTLCPTVVDTFSG